MLHAVIIITTKTINVLSKKPLLFQPYMHAYMRIEWVTSQIDKKNNLISVRQINDMIYAASIWNIWIIPSALQKSLFHQQQHCLQCVHIIKTTYQLLLTHIITVTLILFKNGLTVLVVVTTSSNSCFENLLSFCTYIVLGRSTKFVCARGWGILYLFKFYFWRVQVGLNFGLYSFVFEVCCI